MNKVVCEFIKWKKRVIAKLEKRPRQVFIAGMLLLLLSLLYLLFFEKRKKEITKMDVRIYGESDKMLSSEKKAQKNADRILYMLEQYRIKSEKAPLSKLDTLEIKKLLETLKEYQK